MHLYGSTQRSLYSLMGLDQPSLSNNEAPWCRCLGGIACILHTGHEALTVNTQQLHTANPSADDECNRFIKYNGHSLQAGKNNRSQ